MGAIRASIPDGATKNEQTTRMKPKRPRECAPGKKNFWSLRQSGGRNVRTTSKDWKEIIGIHSPAPLTKHR